MKYIFCIFLCCILVHSTGGIITGDYKKDSRSTAPMEHDKDVKILLRKADRIIRNAESISGNHSGTEKSGSVTTPAKKISNPGRYSQVIMDRGLTSREQLVHFIIRNNTGIILPGRRIAMNKLIDIRPANFITQFSQRNGRLIAAH